MPNPNNFQRGQTNNNGYGNNVVKPALDKISTWVKNGIDKDAVDFAEKAGKYMQSNKLTTSQIRNIYGEIKRIQMGNFENEKTSFYLLKPKIAYAVSRQNNEGIKFFQEVFNHSFSAIETGKEFENFCELMEAMLAFHKANNGK